MSAAAIEEQFIDAFRQRLEHLFSALETGHDTSPAELYGLEGFMEAGLELQLVDTEQLRACIIDCAEHHFSEEVVEQYRNDPQLMLHMRMKRAPVYPSTS